jgi:hypothetical protein
MPPTTPPKMGATQNSQREPSASEPPNSAVAVAACDLFALNRQMDALTFALDENGADLPLQLLDLH